MTSADKQKRARELAKEGRNITDISNKLGISWTEAAGYTISWLGAKQRITYRL